jgi:2-C-methyl-D-erythritol 4-phosphate cytidylyltransferase
MTRVGVVIPAGGSGQRMGGQAKALLLLAGKPMLTHVLERFSDSRVVAIRVVLPAALLSNYSTRDQRVQVVEGGAERTESVRRGIEALPSDIDIVLIHDAARPLVSPELVGRVIDATTPDCGAIAALPATDTVHMVRDGHYIMATPDRKMLWYAQTPQAFPRAMIVSAHTIAARNQFSTTDDAALVVQHGGCVRVVPGETSNIKITVPADLHLAEALLANASQ